MHKADSWFIYIRNSLCRCLEQMRRRPVARKPGKNPVARKIKSERLARKPANFPGVSQTNTAILSFTLYTEFTLSLFFEQVDATHKATKSSQQLSEETKKNKTRGGVKI
eukprot:GEMP01159886.1.p1 GENE.GEMP01159886.1~~GEMP01159886.1.p1  ORF type:complete len:109 (-),score=0.71 GEMP01159886.1:8-334(-)